MDGISSTHTSSVKSLKNLLTNEKTTKTETEATLREMTSKLNSSQESLQWMQSLFKGDSLETALKNVHEATILNVISEIFERNTSKSVFDLKDELGLLKGLAMRLEDLLEHLTENNYRDPVRVCPHKGKRDFTQVGWRTEQ